MNNSTSTTTTCRFQTVAPIPNLKAAIRISLDWTIEDLASKIHQTILEEVAHPDYFHLVSSPNPSHRLILELPDGCRLPLNEPCTIIDKEQILTVRLAPKPQFSLTSSDHTQAFQNNYPLLLSAPINSSQRFASSVTPATHHFKQTSITSNEPPALQPQSSNINISASHSNSQFYQDDQPDDSNHVFLNQTNSFLPSSPSSHLYNATRDPNRSSVSEPQNVQPIHPLSASSPLHFNPVNPELDSNPYSQTFESQSPIKPSSTELNHDIPNEAQDLGINYQSDPEDIKPPPEDLDESSIEPSEAEIPRVRSHIAGLRKSAVGHYHPSLSSSPWRQEESSSCSDDSTCFSRHAQNFKPKAYRPKKSSSRASKRLSLKNKRLQSLNSKRKSLPTQLGSDIVIEEPSSSHSSATPINKVRSERNRVNSPTRSPAPSSPRRVRSSSSNCFPPVVQVRVVIPPPSPSLVSLSQKRKRSTAIVISSDNQEKSQSILPDQSSHSSWSNPRRSKRRLKLSPEFDYSNTNSSTNTNSLTPLTRPMRSMYQIYIDDHLFKAASAKGPMRIPYSNKSGLHDQSTLRDVLKRINLDLNSSWKMIIDDKVWLSYLSLNRFKTKFPNWGLLDGRIIHLDFDLDLQSLAVFPVPNLRHLPSCSIHLELNWDLN